MSGEGGEPALPPPKRAKDGDRFLRASGRCFRGLDEREWTGPFVFVQMADTQLGMLKKDVSWDE